MKDYYGKYDNERKFSNINGYYGKYGNENFFANRKLLR